MNCDGVYMVSSDVIIDPAAIFAMLFGSELFEVYIGQLAMASMASMDIFTEGEEFDAKKLQEKMKVVQKEREEKLAASLKDRPNLYVHGQKDDFIIYAEGEVSRLSNAGAIALIQLQEDMKLQLSAEGNYTEQELEEYMQSHKEVMIDSLWKLNIADIEATVSHVCQMVLQDNTAKKEELRARAKGLKALGKIFQRVKSSDGDENETRPDGAISRLNGSEPSNGPSTARAAPTESRTEEPSFKESVLPSPCIEAPQLVGVPGGYNIPMLTVPPGRGRSLSQGRKFSWCEIVVCRVVVRVELWRY
ncbi:Chaperone protein dnaJ 10-like protein [Drosera capensis]